MLVSRDKLSDFVLLQVKENNFKTFTHAATPDLLTQLNATQINFIFALRHVSRDDLPGVWFDDLGRMRNAHRFGASHDVALEARQLTCLA